MEDAYRAYFREYLAYLEEAGPSPRRLPRWRPEVDWEYGPAHYVARGALERARSDFELRPDAELLLYLLALEFVARPVVAVRGPDAVRGELAENLAADIESVIHSAREKAADGEVTAHSVVDALSQRWDNLLTAGQNIWG